MRNKRQSSQQCDLALLGPTSVKAAHKMLNPGLDDKHKTKLGSGPCYLIGTNLPRELQAKTCAKDGKVDGSVPKVEKV